MFHYNPIINCVVIVMCIVLLVMISIDYNPFRQQIKVPSTIIETFTGESLKLLEHTNPGNPLKKYKHSIK